MDHLNWHECGDGDRVLICLHGFLGESRDWKEFADSFLTHAPGWRLALVELPGHGKAKPGWTCPSAGEFSTALRDFVSSKGWGTAALAGYSLGGRLGLHAALSSPTRFPAFIGISTTAGIEDPEQRAIRLASDLAQSQRLRGDGGFSQFLREWWNQPVFDSPARDEGKFEEFFASRLQRDPVQMATCLEAWSPGALPAQWAALPSYPGRVLLLSGEFDTKYNAYALQMQASFRQSHRLCISGAGHQLLMEKPREVAIAVASFLNRQATSFSISNARSG
ncbi:MAG: alpha/beta fold hydrolase [bacterium]